MERLICNMLFLSLDPWSPAPNLNGSGGGVTRSEGYLGSVPVFIQDKSLLGDRCSAGSWDYQVEEDPTHVKEPTPKRETDKSNQYACNQRLLAVHLYLAGITRVDPLNSPMG